MNKVSRKTANGFFCCLLVMGLLLFALFVSLPALATTDGALSQNEFLSETAGATSGATMEVAKKISLEGPVDTISVTLEWDPSPDDRVVGYRIYYGNASRKYAVSLDVGPKTTFTLETLSGKKPWYFAVKAYDAEGNFSDYSNEVVKAPVLTSQVESTTSSATVAMAVTPDPISLNEPFGVENPAAESESSRIAGSGRGRIVAGIGSPWPVDGGWVKALTDDFFHGQWARVDWKHYNGLQGEARVARGDIDGDGRDELIIGMGSVDRDATAPAGMFEVLDDDLSHLCWGQVNWQVYNEGNGSTWPTCGDLDGDGRDEILIGLGKGGMGIVEVFSFDGSEVRHKTWMASSWKEYNMARGEVRPACGDFDGDGHNDVILGFGRVEDDPELPGGAYEVLSGDGRHLAWGEVSWGDYNQLNGETRPVVGDLDGDGSNEIVIGLGPGANGSFEVQEVDQDGKLTNLAWLAVPWWQEYNQVSGETRPAVGNLDDDPGDEIVVALGKGGGGWLHLFDDREHGFRHFQSLQIWPDSYDLYNGSSWVTILEDKN